jgi:hypothetical protein
MFPRRHDINVALATGGDLAQAVTSVRDTRTEVPPGFGRNGPTWGPGAPSRCKGPVQVAVFRAPDRTAATEDR